MATKSRVDPELSAINTILGALGDLDGESIQRVLDYVIGRLSLGRSTSVLLDKAVSTTSNIQNVPQPTVPDRQISIRDLKEEKNPTSANQMAALVAYYLSEIAPHDERKDTINISDLQKYFKQAGYKLPKALASSLINAAAAGYLDAAERGMYRLNPVGYNLVAHGLPRGVGKSPQIGHGKKK